MKHLLFLATIFLFAGNGWAQNKSPYISKVFEYKPAPGQFVNELPEYKPGDTPEEMALKAEECIAENEQILVSLGGYGGYIIFGFDHMIKNVVGKYDFKILGNAFYANANPNPDAPNEGGSCEPGIVMVSYDANGNGLPDDPWYELAGSEYHKPQTIKNYQLTYYKPDENKITTPDLSYPYLNDTTYVAWKSNQGTQGYVYRNTFHNQSYYPLWLKADSLIFTGTKLANNYIDESGNGSYYVQYAYPWGYVDNHPNSDERSNFKIEWAVDSLGNPVELPGIHFVKVYTGVNQYCGWLGETSTEVMGAVDLHFSEETGIVQTLSTALQLKIFPNPVSHSLHIVAEKNINVTIHNMMGAIVKILYVKTGENIFEIDDLPSGSYILKAGKEKHKIIKN